MSFAVLLLSGCGLYTKYERPDVNTEGLVRDPLNPNDTLSLGKVVDGQWTAVNGQDENFGNMPWRSVFTDPKLQELIQQGLDKNANLLNAALNVKMVEEQLKVAKLAFVPGFTFTPQGTISSWDGGKATKAYSLPVSASWSVDLFGNLLNQKRSAQMALLATKDY